MPQVKELLQADSIKYLPLPHVASSERCSLESASRVCDLLTSRSSIHDVDRLCRRGERLRKKPRRIEQPTCRLKAVAFSIINTPALSLFLIANIKFLIHQSTVEIFPGRHVDCPICRGIPDSGLREKKTAGLIAELEAVLTVCSNPGKLVVDVKDNVSNVCLDVGSWVADEVLDVLGDAIVLSTNVQVELVLRVVHRKGFGTNLLVGAKKRWLLDRLDETVLMEHLSIDQVAKLGW